MTKSNVINCIRCDIPLTKAEDEYALPTSFGKKSGESNFTFETIMVVHASYCGNCGEVSFFLND